MPSSKVKGKFFSIKNKHSGHVLAVKDGSKNPGSLVHTWDKHGGDNELWYEEPLTGTVRNKLNNLCMDLNGDNRLMVNVYQPGAVNQQWRYNKEKNVFESRSSPIRVLDLVGVSKHQGALVCALELHGRANQHWKLQYRPVQYFFIRSALNGKVLDIEGGKTSPGTKLILWPKKPQISDNQLWYEDNYGNIRSKLNNKLVIDATSGTAHTGEFRDGQSRLHWLIVGDKIANRHNLEEVLDVKGNNQSDGAELCVWKYHGGHNQHWLFDYV